MARRRATRESSMPPSTGSSMFIEIERTLLVELVWRRIPRAASAGSSSPLGRKRFAASPRSST